MGDRAGTAHHPGELEEWDFHGLDLARDIEIEVVLGQLGSELTQRFMAELEFWDPERELVLAGSDATQQLAAAGATPVLRLAYHGRWDESEERGEHWVAFAKNSDPDADQFTRVPRADRAVLPFLFQAPAAPWRSPPKVSSGSCWSSAAATTSPRRCATWLPGSRSCRPRAPS